MEQSWRNGTAVEEGECRLKLVVALANDRLEFRCTQCKRKVQAAYGGAPGGIPQITCRCPSCEGVQTVKLLDVQGMPKSPSHDFRGAD